MPLCLTETDVREMLDPVEMIDTMELALAAFSAGQVVQPVRAAFEMGERSLFAVMPAFDAERARITFSNRGRGSLRRGCRRQSGPAAPTQREIDPAD